MQIDLPFRSGALTCKGRVVWKTIEQKTPFPRYSLGVEFTGIKEQESASLFRYALWLRFLPRLTAAVLLALVVFSYGLWYEHTALVKENTRLLNRYHETVRTVETYEDIIENSRQSAESYTFRQNELNEKIKILQAALTKQRASFKDLEEKEESTVEEKYRAQQLKQLIRELEEEKGRLINENDYLKKKLDISRRLTANTSRQLDLARDLKREYVPRIIEGMCQWITTRQNLRSGLVLSYEGDAGLKQTAFSYDQALAAIVFTLYDRSDRAARILDFYLAQARKDKPFYNGYYTNGSVFEYIRHSGPNAWLGLAALNYTQKTGKQTYLKVADQAAVFLLEMMDEEGGVKGGPENSWYSTEHNLDSYAFFMFFYELSGNEKYRAAAEKIKKWIDRYAYTDKEVPINRGKGDATIATDTYAWSLTALGPGELSQMHMIPVQILDFAVENCKVETSFSSGSSLVEITGFDFAKPAHAARGGVVSGEWTSQMILAYEIMADYFQDSDQAAAGYYFDQARYYFEELQKMLINSPSPSGKAYPTLPYASQPGVATGHGWRTPQGRCVGSLASTAYFLISYQGYNPLRGHYLSRSLKDTYQPQTASLSK